MYRFFSLLSFLIVVSATVGSTAEVRTVQVDKAELIRIDRDPGIVLVANPDIADVVIENKRLLFVLGRREGETRLFVLDGRGDEILNLDVVVTGVAERRITVQRGTAELTLVCTPRCVAQAMPNAGGAAASPAAAPALPGQ